MKKRTSAVVMTSAIFAALFLFNFYSAESVSAPVMAVHEAVRENKIELLQQNRLIIPAIGVDAPIRGMGLELNGKMAVPNNFAEIGWYNLGTKPGEIGSAVMGAHVDNGRPTGSIGSVPGVFKNLKNLSVGDVIYVYDEKGKKTIFRVSYTKIFAPNEKDTTEIFAQNDKARLNLITCHGKWIPSINNYNERLVVFSEKVNQREARVN